MPAAGSRENVSGHKDGIVETVVYSFSGVTGSMGDGAGPKAGLINVGGTLYGTTFNGGFYYYRDTHGHGTGFFDNSVGKEALHRFLGLHDGQYPYAGLLNVGGVMHGTTRDGGEKKRGTYLRSRLTAPKRYCIVPGGRRTAGGRKPNSST